MFCKKCESSIHVKKIWHLAIGACLSLLLATLLTSVSAPGLAKSTSSVEWLTPIDIQLRALRERDISRAYNDSTSKEFKDNTSLDTFTKFVEKYPILVTHQEIVISSQSVKNNEADITVTLNPDKFDATPLRFMLVSEEGKWKIWNENVILPYSPAVTALLKDPQTLRKPVEQMLQALQSKEAAKAYDAYMSQEFKKGTSLDAFRDFLKKFPLLTTYESVDFGIPGISEGTGTLEVNLESRDTTAKLEYNLGIEGDKWKIWGIKVLQYVGQDSVSASVSKSEKTGTAETDKGVEISKVEVGSAIDSKGNIINPRNEFEVPKNDIFLNLYVKKGKAGSKIIVDLEHIATHATLPTASTTLQQEGDSRVSFAFAPPSQGWPKGRYQLQIHSSEGGEARNFTFELK